ncbi:MAG: hypothetical protein JRG93_09620 [Deltaproteobacteria bacterium]|nr:hypothetical protein [Deltaproteobacteria bacterium]
MERLTGQDASFLYMETPSVHMHTLKVAVIDLPAKIPYADVFDLVRVSMESKLHLVPRLRRRPVEVPGGLHHPVWVEDPNFNIGRHLYRARIEQPGGHREMDQAIAEIASTQLPRDRPLWETWLHHVGGGDERRAQPRRSRRAKPDLGSGAASVPPHASQRRGP